MKTELQKLYALIDDIEVAMMTTRHADGHMHTRPMANQKQASGADLWFVAAEGTEKLADLLHDDHINLAYFRESDKSWVSVSGLAFLSRERAKIHELYEPDWSVWFSKDGDDPRHGTPDDPRMVLIGVKVHQASFLDVGKSKPVILYEIVKGVVTGTEPQLGEMHELREPHRPTA